MTPHGLLELATSLAHDAGTLAFEGRKSGLSSVGTKSTATDMVTEYDRASERLIVERLRRERPEDSIIGEEGASFDGTSGIEWCIDPIDGTTNFTYALPNWAVSIGVSDRSGPLLGVVYVPPLGETFTAVRGEGASLNGERITCSETSEISQALVCTGFSYSAHQRSIQSARVARMIHEVRDIRRFGAASIDMCYVACGRLDAYFEENLFPWDIAAGALIAREAGCRLGDFRGGALRPAEALVATPAVFDELSAMILRASAPTDNN
jgi:myo-inositol-1(or 4)-monophosphatase